MQFCYRTTFHAFKKNTKKVQKWNFSCEKKFCQSYKLDSSLSSATKHERRNYNLNTNIS